MGPGILKLAFAVVVVAMSAARDEVRAAQPGYDLPADCPAFAEHHDQTWDEIGDQMEVNWFHYAEAICEQYFLAKKSAKTAKRDYVSDLDFATLPLDQIPYISCEVGTSSREYLEWCRELDHQFPTLTQARFLVFWNLFDRFTDFPETTAANIMVARAVSTSHQTCRLEKREFGGFADFERNLIIEDGRATCIRAPYQELEFGFTVEIARTLFRDVDVDGYMDALLIVHENGGGSASDTKTIVVAKKRPGPGPLTRVRTQGRWE